MSLAGCCVGSASVSMTKLSGYPLERESGRGRDERLQIGQLTRLPCHVSMDAMGKSVSGLSSGRLSLWEEQVLLDASEASRGKEGGMRPSKLSGARHATCPPRPPSSRVLRSPVARPAVVSSSSASIGRLVGINQFPTDGHSPGLQCCQRSRQSKCD
jgi:hypothetical protein